MAIPAIKIKFKILPTPKYLKTIKSVIADETTIPLFVFSKMIEIVNRSAKNNNIKN